MALLEERLHGDKIALRPVVDRDGEAIFGYLSTDPEIAHWTRIPWPYTRGHLAAFLGQVDASRSGTSELVCAVTTADSDVLIGCCGVYRIGATWQPRSSFLPAEVGYWLAAPFRGQSMMRGAVTLLSQYALTDLGLDVLNLQTKVANVASQHLASSAGFQYIETVVARDVDDDEADHHRYSMSIADFEGANGAVAPLIRSGL